MTNLTGQSIGRYHILEQLGQGGMAVVYKAFDTRLEREVALKVIRKGAFPPDSFDRILKRFEREAKALARLSHPNIVKVLDYGDHDGSPYLVLEYLPGGTLKQFTGQPMPWPQAISLLLPVARALAYAHGHGIIHRDIKPGNILISESGEPLLTDFGIAKLLELEDGQTLTATGVGIGTPEYMSPEQGIGRNVDARTDVYSLGIVLYELVTGRKPYTADTPMAVVMMQASDPLPRPTELNPDLPQALEELLIKALAKKPEHRYEDMPGMIAALERLAGASPQVQPARPFQPPPDQVSEPGSQATIDEAAEKPSMGTVDQEPAPPPVSTKKKRSTASPRKLQPFTWSDFWNWVLLTTIALAVTMGLGTPSDGLSLVFAGVSVGLAQAWVLRGKLTLPVSAWVYASAVAVPVGMLLAYFLTEFVDFENPLAMVPAGLLLGIAQWLVVREQLKRAWLYILVCGIAFLMAYIDIEVLLFELGWPLPFLTGLVLSIFTGWVLIFNLNTDQPAQVLDGALESEDPIATARQAIPDEKDFLYWLGAWWLSLVGGMAVFMGIGELGLGLLGLPLGLLQWLVLRRFLRLSFWFAPLTSLGVFVGMALSIAAIESLDWQFVFLLGLAGLVSASAQAWMLYPQKPDAVWYILVNLLGWGLMSVDLYLWDEMSYATIFLPFISATTLAFMTAWVLRRDFLMGRLITRPPGS